MKKIVSIITTFLLSISITSCMSHIEDVNGDDISLESINILESITSKTYSSISSTSSKTCSGGSTYSFNYREIDYDSMEIVYGKISGVEKIHCSDMSEGEELILNITSASSSGNIEIVVVTPSNTIYQNVEVNKNVIVTIPSTEEGEYFVIIGAESASVSITIEREIN